LNDLHRTFPAFLYGGEEFQNVHDIFDYIHRQMSNQYDVFSNRRSRFQQNRQSRNRNRRRYTPLQAPQAPPGPPPLINPTSPLSYVYRTTIPDESTTLLNLINRAVGQDPTFFIYPTPMNFQDAVPIIPTPAELQAGSVLQTPIGVEEAICSICQQTMVTGETIRHLTVCHHKFHRDCIDQWFQRHARCPVCRHDIRVTQSG